MKLDNYFLSQFLVLGALILGLSSCRPSQELAIKANDLSSEVRSAWDQLEQADSRKFKLIRAVGKEIKKQKNYNKQLTDSLHYWLQTTEKLRLTGEKMIVSDNIDRYDEATKQLLDMLSRASESLSLPCEPCKQLTDSIKAIDNDDLVRRIYYDKKASLFNEFLNTEKTNLLKIKAKYGQMKPLPLFSLSE
jgi:hypothetical protein